MSVFFPNCPWVYDPSKDVELGFLDGKRVSSAEYSGVLIAIWKSGGFVFMILFMYIS